MINTVLLCAAMIAIGIIYSELIRTSAKCDELEGKINLLQSWANAISETTTTLEKDLNCLTITVVDVATHIDLQEEDSDEAA